MGYETRFKLTFDEKDPETSAAREFLDWGSLKNTSVKNIKEYVRSNGGGTLDDFLSRVDALELRVSRSAVAEAVELIRDVRDGNTGAMKWYEHEKDMRAFSKLFPKVLLTLHGEGEEAGDMWIKYFLGGKCQLAKAEIIYEPFDPKKLE